MTLTQALIAAVIMVTVLGLLTLYIKYETKKIDAECDLAWKNRHPSRNPIGEVIYKFTIHSIEIHDDGSVWVVYNDEGHGEPQYPINRVMIVGGIQ